MASVASQLIKSLHMRKVTVWRMRERYAQTVLTFQITYVLTLRWIYFLLSILFSETSVLDFSFLRDCFWSLTGPWTCRTPGALCLYNLSHGRVGEVAATARRIVGFIRLCGVAGPIVINAPPLCLIFNPFYPVSAFAHRRQEFSNSNTSIHIFLSPKIVSLFQF